VHYLEKQKLKSTNKQPPS